MKHSIESLTTALESAQSIEALTTKLAAVTIPAEYRRAPELVAKLMQLGALLLPGARLDVCEHLAVLHVYASTNLLGFTSRDVERYKQDAIRGGYVARTY